MDSKIIALIKLENFPLNYHYLKEIKIVKSQLPLKQKNEFYKSKIVVKRPFYKPIINI